MTVSVVYNESTQPGCRKISFKKNTPEAQILADAMRNAAIGSEYDNTTQLFVADISQAKFDQVVRSTGIDVESLSTGPLAGRPIC